MKHPLLNSVLFIVALILAACTASSSQAPSAISTPVPQQPSWTSTLVPAILPTPLSIIPFEERLLATIDIKYPDELTFVHGFIWVKTDDGHLIQVDPAKNSVVGDIKIDTTSDPYHYCQGLGTDGENIWACSASGDEDHRTIDVVRIDPKSQSVVETVKVGKIFDQFNMPFLFNQIWVLSGNGDKLVGIDITTNQPSPAIDLGTRCFQVAVVSNSLLLTCKLDNLMLRIDPEKMEVTERLTFPSPRNITATENGIWLSQDNAVVRLDTESLNPVATFTKLYNAADIFATNEAVWVRLEDGFLYRIDPVSNELIEQIKTDRSLSVGGIIVTPDSIWTTAGDDNLLIRLNLR
jgi:DNA-binding beta-propeller fold protein YncE